MSELILVRHGETEWAVSGKHTGRTDIPLTDRGRDMARIAGQQLKNRTFVRVLTSPLQRAYETCVLAGYGEQAQARDDLYEWHYGLYEGKTTAEIRKDNPTWSLWTDGAREGETPEEVGARVDNILAEVRATEGDTLIFAHGHVLRVLTARWLDLAPSAGRYFALTVAAISILGYEREQPVIKQWNITGNMHR